MKRLEADKLHVEIHKVLHQYADSLLVVPLLGNLDTFSIYAGFRVTRHINNDRDLGCTVPKQIIMHHSESPFKINDFNDELDYMLDKLVVGIIDAQPFSLQLPNATIKAFYGWPVVKG